MERTDPDSQGGFTWTVTFTSDNQDGDLPLMTVEIGDTTELTGLGAVVAVSPGTDGSYLGGNVGITFEASGRVVFPADATAEDVRTALEGIGTGSLAVSREGAHLLPAI